MNQIQLGIDQLEAKIRKDSKSLKKLKFAALCHPASLTKNFIHLESILEKSCSLKSLFGPQHGIRGETQDNMIEWQDFKDSSGRSIYSLYGERRKPTRESLNGIDIVVADLFDVGSRYYTFIYTLAYMMEACAESGARVWVCDRPNPLGGSEVEGPLLNLNYRSFVGRYELPIVHGMTIGELAKFFNTKIEKSCDLTVLPLRGWKRKSRATDLKGYWAMPSPNMPNASACDLYPGMCLLEGTDLSEGRGTTRPFELIGAPFFEWDKIEREYLKIMKTLKLQPAIFIPQGFIPTFHKFQGQLCKGALQVIKDPRTFKPLRHATVLLWIFRRLYGAQWGWKQPPYEYEFKKLPIDILAGNEDLRETIDKGLPLNKLFKQWETDEREFRKTRKPFLLYS